MPTSDKQSEVETTSGNRGGVLQHPIQRGQEYSLETNWEEAFKVLSSIVSRQMISSDSLVLIAYALRKHVSDEVLFEYMNHVGLNRSKSVQNFMG